MAAADVHPIQRPLKGSRISSFYPVKDIPPLSSLDSAFQLQEYISLLIRKDVHDVDAIVTIPGKGKQREGSDGEGKGDDGEGAESKEVTVDEACWIYEQLRRLAQDLSHPLITMLQQECTRQTCPEMKAGEWLYLCVAHGTEGAMEQCCAIDYILHTLDSATSLLNSPRNFPSRLSIPAPSHRHFSSLARRLGRIFAHAYFHHRAAFAQAEAESALYARFLALTSRFALVPAEFLVIPPGIVGYEEHDGPDEYPRSMLGAALDPHRERERGREDEPRGVLHVDTLGEPLPGGEERREPSPRKMGRNRTDTMVHSEIASVVGELERVAMVGFEGGLTGTRVPSAEPDDVQKKEEATTAEEPPETQPTAELEPAAESEAPAALAEPENVTEDPQTKPAEVVEQSEAEHDIIAEEAAPPAEEPVPAEEADITTAEPPLVDATPEPSSADTPSGTDPESHVEPTSQADAEGSTVEEEPMAHPEGDKATEPEILQERHAETESDSESKSEPPEDSTEDISIDEVEAAIAETQESVAGEGAEADVVEGNASEVVHEAAETKDEEGEEVGAVEGGVTDGKATDGQTESHPEPETAPEGAAGEEA